jgi:glycosyltransferase involved in cell wall biosynthesis
LEVALVCSHINHAESLGVRERIEFTGYTDNVGGYLEKLDVVLVCANNEALGRATIEAMLFGKCVIGKRSGATPELINHNQNGLLYDTVAELARYIDLLYRNPALMNKIAAKAQRSAVTNFSSGKSIRNIYNEFVRLIE